MEQQLTKKILEQYPRSLTFVATYKCTAACEQCCFECSPELSSRLSREQMITTIDDAKSSFSALQVVVFSGGECFTLKEDLYAAIKHCTELGFKSRCVTNGYWGKNFGKAEDIASILVMSGLTEVNFSTGSDHVKFVDLQSVLNAAIVCVRAGISTLITIEEEAHQSSVRESLIQSPEYHELSNNSLFKTMTNSWMAFNSNYDRGQKKTFSPELYKGCSQVLENVVVTPHYLVSSCCGLTYEHIPEMKIGNLRTDSILEAYQSQLDDFMKIWIKIKGPLSIATEVMGEEYVKKHFAGSNHICDTCSKLYNSPEIIEKIKTHYHSFISEIIFRFTSNLEIQRIAIEGHKT